MPPPEATGPVDSSYFFQAGVIPVLVELMHCAGDSKHAILLDNVLPARVICGAAYPGRTARRRRLIFRVVQLRQICPSTLLPPVLSVLQYTFNLRRSGAGD